MGLLEAARPLAEALTTWPKRATVRLVAHHDPDGVAAAAVAVRCLSRIGRPFHATYTWRHDLEFLEGLERSPEDPIVLLDLGASLLDRLGKVAAAGCVVDHHPPIKATIAKGWQMLNPWSVGLDGARDACASTTALALAVVLDEKNWDLAPVALAGAVGDEQHRGGFTGWNAEVLETARKRKAIGWEPFPDLDDLPLADLLRWPPPSLRAIVDGKPSGDFLAELGIPGEATPFELEPDERQRLASRLALGGLKAGEAAELVRASSRWLPTSPAHGNRPVVRLASLLEAATRQGEPGAALAFLLGDAGVMGELAEIEATFHGVLRGILEKAGAAVRTDPAYRLLEIGDVKLTGVVAGHLIRRLLEPDRPVFVAARTLSEVRVSGRATTELVAKGLDLGKAMAGAAERVGGTGGGHAIAAGASIPLGRLDAFLENVGSAKGTKAKAVRRP